jgi:hypothetical protein
MYNRTSRGVDRYPPTSEIPSAESKDKIVVATNILLVYSRVVDQGKRTCSRFQHKTNTYCGWASAILHHQFGMVEPQRK